jgi:hypothetical protein
VLAASIIRAITHRPADGGSNTSETSENFNQTARRNNPATLRKWISAIFC